MGRGRSDAMRSAAALPGYGSRVAAGSVGGVRDCRDRAHGASRDPYVTCITEVSPGPLIVSIQIGPMPSGIWFIFLIKRASRAECPAALRLLSESAVAQRHEGRFVLQGGRLHRILDVDMCVTLTRPPL